MSGSSAGADCRTQTRRASANATQTARSDGEERWRGAMASSDGEQRWRAATARGEGPSSGPAPASLSAGEGEEHGDDLGAGPAAARTSPWWLLRLADAASGEQRPLDFGPALFGQRRHQGPEPRAMDDPDVIQIERTDRRHAIVRREGHPRIVRVAGTAMSSSRRSMTPSRVSKRTGLFLSGAAKVYQRTSPLRIERRCGRVRLGIRSRRHGPAEQEFGELHLLVARQLLRDRPEIDGREFLCGFSHVPGPAVPVCAPSLARSRPARCWNRDQPMNGQPPVDHPPPPAARCSRRSTTRRRQPPGAAAGRPPAAASSSAQPPVDHPPPPAARCSRRSTPRRRQPPDTAAGRPPAAASRPRTGGGRARSSRR